MIQALFFLELGGPETLRLSELPPPEPGNGELRVRALVRPINYPHMLIAARQAGAGRTLGDGRGPFGKEDSKALPLDCNDAVGPEGARVADEPVGGDYAEPALRSSVWDRYLVAGFPADIHKLPHNLIHWKRAT